MGRDGSNGHPVIFSFLFFVSFAAAVEPEEDEQEFILVEVLHHLFLWLWDMWRRKYKLYPNQNKGKKRKIGFLWTLVTTPGKDEIIQKYIFGFSDLFTIVCVGLVCDAQ